MGKHYIPQEYLRQFVPMNEPEKVWRCDRQTRQFKLLPIAAVAQSPSFYFDEDERALNEAIEGPAQGPLQKLRNSEQIDSDERQKIALYIQLMMTRVPHAKDKRRKLLKDRYLDLYAEAEQRLLKKSSDLPPNLMEDLKREDNRWKVSDIDQLPSDLLDELVKRQIIYPRIVETVYAMTWRIIRSNVPRTFLTSDNPVFYFEGLGLGHPDAEITFPLASQAVLHASWQGFREGLEFTPARPQLAMEINRHTVCGADRFLFFCENAKWVKEIAKAPRRRVRRIVWNN